MTGYISDFYFLVEKSSKVGKLKLCSTSTYACKNLLLVPFQIFCTKTIQIGSQGDDVGANFHIKLETFH